MLARVTATLLYELELELELILIYCQVLITMKVPKTEPHLN